MQRMLVMTVIGQDRPGLVESLAAVVVAKGGNWLESRMARLGGQFAGILRVEVPKEQELSLTREVQQLSSQGLTVVVQPDQPQATDKPTRLSAVEIVGQDRPGIVRQISRTLAKYGVNVEELNTKCGSAAMSGETLFQANAHIRIPTACDTAALKRELEKIAADLIVEIKLEELSEG